MKTVLNFAALFLIALIKAGGYFKKFFSVFFISLVYRPLRYFLRIFFYQIVVRLYFAQRTFFRKIGWSGVGNNFFSFMFYHRLVHVLVIIITCSLLFVNFSTKTLAGGYTNFAGKTILADLINPELGSGFKEDEQLVVETFDQELEISLIQQSYLDNLGSVRDQPRVLTDGALYEDEDFLPSIQSGSSLLKTEIAETLITKRDREEIITHTVVSNDTISTIAREYGISVTTILWENNLSVYSIIRPGDKLDILPISGISHKVKSGENLGKIAKDYKVEEEDILNINKLANASLQIGQKLIIPGGTKPVSIAYTPKTYTGFEAIKNIIAAPSSAKPVSGNKMNWPTEGSRISQYYSWRHLGLDIANKNGTPLYAADAGVVEFAGWGTGYGNQIVIDHGGGKKTRYAHASKLFVGKGDKVDKGQSIASMGSTGWSTGPHLHFEVIINGRKMNPLDYIK